VCVASVVSGGITRFRSARRDAGAALQVVDQFVQAGARHDPAAATWR
jgi:hypothetical protein